MLLIERKNLLKPPALRFVVPTADELRGGKPPRFCEDF
jgi:hypothetical protein